jgi:hypothetical protein
MIRWPPESKLSAEDRLNLARFRRSAAAEELGDDAHTWELESTSWTGDYPVRLIWRNEEGQEVCFTIEDTGLWRLVPYASRFVPPRSEDPLTPLGRRW